jgi:hypothetical protein
MPELTPEEIKAEEEAKLAAEAEAAEEEAEAARLAEEGAEAARLAEEEANADNEDDSSSDKKKKTAQERIDEITWKFREAERQTTYWKKLATGDSDAEHSSESDKPGKPAEGQRPVADNFDTVAEYEDALFGWYDNKRTTQNRVRGEAARLNKDISVFKKNAATFKESHSDFDKVLETPVFTDAMRKVLFPMDVGAELAYYIAKNKDVGESFNGLSPEMQIVQIMELKHKFATNKVGNLLTKAPAPFEGVGDHSTLAKDPDKMSTDEWMKWNKERDLAILEKKMGEGK